MKILRFLLLLIISGYSVFYLETSHNGIPPIGELISPFNGFWTNYQLDNIDLDDEIELTGVSDQVSIIIDEYDIPHIYASNEEDLYFAQGYITAYHRLFQMDFLAHVAEGRLSEFFGKALLNFDRKQRRQGIARAAEKSLVKLQRDGSCVSRLNAFTLGVNQYIEELSYRKYPIEYKLIGASPEKWTNLKTVLSLKQLSFNLSGYSQDFELSQSLATLGKDTFDILFPDYHESVEPAYNRLYRPRKSIENQLTRMDIDTSFFNDIVDHVNSEFEDNGSTAFAVSGSNTMNEKTILASQPDLPFYLPGFWYLVHLNAPEVNVFGASIAGIPGIIIGFNESIAWGNTNSEADVLDWYRINFTDQTREEYIYDSKRLKTQKIHEKIEVKDSDSFVDTVLYTHFGPVVYDKNFKGKVASNFAMKWVGHEPSMELKTIFEVNKAQNITQFRDAFESFVSPAQNYILATANDSIGMFLLGKIPKKWNLQGRFIMDGANRSYEWGEYLSPSELPYMINPKQGFVYAANQHLVNQDRFPYYLSGGKFEDYRHRRIKDRLKVLPNMRVENIMQIQNDNFNYHAFENLDFLVESIANRVSDSKQLKYLDELKSWDFFNGSSRKAPIVFSLWWEELSKSAWHRLYNDSIRFARPTKLASARAFQSLSDTSHIYDVDSTIIIESFSDHALMTFKNTVEMLDSLENDITWGTYKNTTIKHYLGSKLKAFNVKAVVGGGKNIVNAVKKDHGPSLRLIVELSKDKVKAWAIYPGSQTGNPFNVNYGNMVEHWAKGQYYPMHYDDYEAISSLPGNKKTITLKKER